MRAENGKEGAMRLIGGCWRILMVVVVWMVFLRSRVLVLSWSLFPCAQGTV